LEIDLQYWEAEKPVNFLFAESSLFSVCEIIKKKMINTIKEVFLGFVLTHMVLFWSFAEPSPWCNTNIAMDSLANKHDKMLSFHSNSLWLNKDESFCP
jgi:hypothetical protein